MFESSSRRAIVAAASLAFVVGCSGNAGSLAPNQASSSNKVLVGMHSIQGAAVEHRLLVPSVPHPWALPHAWPNKKKRQILFVADPQNNQILMYNPKTPNPTPEGSITSGVDYTFGLAVDKKGTLYAANLLGGTAGSISHLSKRFEHAERNDHRRLQRTVRYRRRLKGRHLYRQPRRRHHRRL